MRTLSKNIGVLAVCLISSVAQAWEGNNLTINYIETNVNANSTVYFNEATPNPANCSQGPLKVVSWDGADTSAAPKNFMAMMLAAKTANRPVQVLVDSTACLWGGWPKLSTMKLM